MKVVNNLMSKKTVRIMTNLSGRLFKHPQNDRKLEINILMPKIISQEIQR